MIRLFQRFCIKEPLMAKKKAAKKPAAKKKSSSAKKSAVKKSVAKKKRPAKKSAAAKKAKKTIRPKSKKAAPARKKKAAKPRAARALKPNQYVEKMAVTIERGEKSGDIVATESLGDAALVHHTVHPGAEATAIPGQSYQDLKKLGEGAHEIEVVKTLPSTSGA